MEPVTEAVPSSPERKLRWGWSSAILLLIAAAVIYTQLTIFVIPPIGALPEGRTVIILRLNKTEFIDSPDAMCERIQGGVSLLCRGMALGAVGEKSTKIVSLPYSRTLYLISTGDKTYDR
jgi:hypothetical protein